MKKKLIILLLSSFYLSSIFCDATNDNIPQKTKFRDKAIYFMKFRGSTSLVWTYIFTIQDGITNYNHTANINYSPIDYTDKGDPLKNHHTGDGRIIGGTWGGTEMKIYANYDFIAPFLNSNHSLFKKPFL